MIGVLRNPVRHYAWGSTTAIPDLLGIDPDGRPHAELWLGTHPAAPSSVVDGSHVQPLIDLVGARGSASTGLPYLLKVLAAATPLSLQVHPGRDRARAGYADEESRGVPADAPERRYPDANHKPELVSALTPFRLAVGFRDPAESAALLECLDVRELRADAAVLRGQPDAVGIRTVLTRWLRLAGPDAASLAGAVAAAAMRPAGSDAERCARENVAILASHFPKDIGIVVSLLMHHLVLAAGDGLFVPAGTLHTYLGGTAVEILASSDNVVRAGLTPKHVDVDAVLELVDTRPGPAAILTPRVVAGAEAVYETPATDFRLSRVVVTPETPVLLPTGVAQIVLVVAGDVQIAQGGTRLAVRRGQSVFADAGGPAVSVRGQSGPATLFRATTPAAKDAYRESPA